MIFGINEGHTLTGVGTGVVGIVKETDKNREVGVKRKRAHSNQLYYRQVK